MQGRKEFTPKMMYQLHLDEMVPNDNFYRMVDKALDLSFLYNETRKFYGMEGQESIDPVVFFKLCLVGYFNNINSDRRIVEYCSNCLDIRLFIRYDLDEVLPWHSTISRTRQLFGEEVFQSIFKRVLSLCVQKGMVRGKRQAVDSVFIKANASMDSLLEKEIIEDAEVYCKELNEGMEDKEDKTKNAEDEEQNYNQNKSTNTQLSLIREESNTTEERDCEYTKKTSNATHYSTTDKDARMSTKPGKPTQLNYYGQFAVDDTHHVITGAMADFADKRDSQCLPDILIQTIENLSENEIIVEQVLADTNYSSGESLDFCIENNIDAYIPNAGGYKPIREGFEYDETNDRFLCTRGNKAMLPFKGFKKKHRENDIKIYLSSGRDCRSCALRMECIGKGNIKKITCSIHKPLFDAMHEKMQTPYAKRLMKTRMRTVEPVLGTLINFRGMKRVNSRGIEQANKHVLMAAIAYNLMKYLKFIRMKANVKIQVLGQEVINSQKIAFARFIKLFWKYSIIMRFCLCQNFWLLQKTR
jgi:transposase